MNNRSTAAAYSTANQGQFKMEVILLMKKIQSSIDSMASKVKSYQEQPARKEATSLGVLKIHEYKLKEILKWLEGLDDAEWIEDKADLIKDYEAAYQAFSSRHQ